MTNESIYIFTNNYISLVVGVHIIYHLCNKAFASACLLISNLQLPRPHFNNIFLLTNDKLF